MRAAQLSETKAAGRPADYAAALVWHHRLFLFPAYWEPTARYQGGDQQANGGFRAEQTRWCQIRMTLSGRQLPAARGTKPSFVDQTMKGCFGQQRTFAMYQRGKHRLIPWFPLVSGKLSDKGSIVYELMEAKGVLGSDRARLDAEAQTRDAANPRHRQSRPC